MSTGRPRLELTTDVLVVGGGPAATWAALAARRSGARVVLVDKGFCGTSGVAAAATVGHWWVAPADRPDEIAARLATGGALGDPSRMARVLAAVWAALPEVIDADGYRRGPRPVIQGAVYLRAMRRRLSRAGVRILDHSPALGLLTDPDGAVRGAHGVRRQHDRAWRVDAPSVVLATGGCAFRSGCLGGNVVTGDGLLMAAEAGAELSGMEFSTYYGLVPRGTSVDKNGYFLSATYYDGDGTVVDQGWSPPAGVLGTALPQALRRGPVTASFDLVPAADRPRLRADQPNLFLAFDRLGVDPFRDRFPIEPILEGTVRGTGGVLTVDDDGATGVPGLWVAGDTASREPVVGAASGAGAANAAWAVASGSWAGRAAARRAAATGATVAGAPLAGVGLGPARMAAEPGAARELEGIVRQELLPLERGAGRDAAGLRASLARLDGAWADARETLGGGDPRSALAARETAAMLAAARWARHGALGRPESRVMHRRADHPHEDPAQRRRVVLSGVDRPTTRVVPLPVPAAAVVDAARRRDRSLAPSATTPPAP